MSEVASSALLTAIKNSLDDSSVGWVVTGCEPTVDYYTGYTRTLTSLRAGHLPQSAASGAPMTIQVETIYNAGMFGGQFIDAWLYYAGAKWQASDSTLASKVLTKAVAWLGALDTSFKNLLVAGPVADVLAIPSDLLTALKASLADTSVGWTVRARTESITPDGLQVTTVLTSEKPLITVTADHKIRGTLTYISTWDAAGNLLAGRVMLDGAEWRSSDTGLAGTVATMGTAYLGDQHTSLTADLS